MATDEEILLFEEWVALDRDAHMGEILDVLSDEQKKTLLTTVFTSQKQSLEDHKQRQEEAIVKIDQLIADLDKPK